MNWPDGWTVVEGWKGAKGVEPRYHRAPDGLAGRLDDRGGVDLRGSEVAQTLRDFGHGWQGQQNDTNAVVQHYRKSTRAASVDHDETWVPDARTVELVTGVGAVSDDGLPLGLDSHRYRCCGNGVVSSVAEWIGYRLAEALA